MKIYVAPVQGHTDVAWRYFHHKIYGGNLRYFTPFLRCERGEPRLKDIRDFKNSLNGEVDLEPQVIFRDMDELEILLRPLVDAGAKSVNLNMGCPFPPQMAKGRGAAFILNVSEAEKLPGSLAHYPEVRFSVKMRLGMENSDEWKGIIGILNSIELENIYLHPRVARQKYTGDLHPDSFREFLEASANPVVFNGDVKTPNDMGRVIDTFPNVNGIMVARGVLCRPSLPIEFDEGEWSKERRLSTMIKFHQELFHYYKSHLCGEAQILSKIKPFWEYAEGEIGRKAWKALKKSASLSKYEAALKLI